MRNKPVIRNNAKSYFCDIKQFLVNHYHNFFSGHEYCKIKVFYLPPEYDYFFRDINSILLFLVRSKNINFKSGYIKILYLLGSVKISFAYWKGIMLFNILFSLQLN